MKIYPQTSLSSGKPTPLTKERKEKKVSGGIPCKIPLFPSVSATDTTLTTETKERKKELSVTNKQKKINKNQRGKPLLH